MVKKILFVLAFAIGAVATIAALQPDHYRVARTATMAAPPEAVFGLVNDFHQWSRWSPWEKLDPNMKRTFSGPDSGPGAAYAWTGNDAVGRGKMTVEESKASEQIAIKLEFLEPFASSSMIRFQFRPEGTGTSVTWEMNGENGFVAKVFGLFMNMDKMVGGDFEKGLAQLKAAAEPAKP